MALVIDTVGKNMASYCNKACIGCNRVTFASSSLRCNNYYILRQVEHGNTYNIMQQSSSVAKKGAGYCNDILYSAPDFSFIYYTIS